MSEFTLMDVTIDPFDIASVRSALQKVNHIRRRLQPALIRLINQMAKKGVEIARAELIFFDRPAYDTGYLSESIHSIPYNGDAAYVTTDCYYAAYVEFGTGSVGQHSAINPEASNIGTYTQNGWVYYNERLDRFVWTKGMAARPFMYHTFKDLIAEVEAVGGQIIAEYIA